MYLITLGSFEFKIRVNFNLVIVSKNTKHISSEFLQSHNIQMFLQNEAVSFQTCLIHLDF